jgi:hypothetical protein
MIESINNKNKNVQNEKRLGGFIPRAFVACHFLAARLVELLISQFKLMVQ